MQTLDGFPRAGLFRIWNLLVPLLRPELIWQVGVWIETHITLSLSRMICIPQFSKYHKSGNKIKIEMNIRDIFQRGKAKPVEVGSFQSVLHSNCTFYPKRSSTSHITTASTQLSAPISGVEHRRGRSNVSKDTGPKMLIGKVSISIRP